MQNRGLNFFLQKLFVFLFFILCTNCTIYRSEGRKKFESSATSDWVQQNGLEPKSTVHQNSFNSVYLNPLLEDPDLAAIWSKIILEPTLLSLQPNELLKSFENNFYFYDQCLHDNNTRSQWPEVCLQTAWYLDQLLLNTTENEVSNATH